MPLAPNTLLQSGKYKIVRFLSSGGFGCTYEGEHVMLHKRIAIKEFFVKDFCNRDENTSHVTVGTQSKVALVEKLRSKFIDEAVSLSQLSHPNIVSVSDVFMENGTAYYVMDFLDGKSLHQIINERGALPEGEAISYIKDAAEALKYVHSLNRLHLDIKPGNIMVTNDGHAKLIDFGASKQYDEIDGENTSTLLGKTPGYAPIEQMGNRVQTFSAATDIYALGATFYKLITGETPADATEIADDEEALSPISDTISRKVRETIMKSLEVRRKDRQQSIDEFLSMLSFSNDNVKSERKTTNSIVNDDERTLYNEEILHNVEIDNSVDLGLSIRWGSCNLGAKFEQDFGTFYQWPTLESDDNVSNQGDYCDTGCISSTKWDYARKTLGSTWRMPSSDEFKELMTKCRWQWTNRSGVNGYQIIGPNGNSIFLPAAGYHDRYHVEKNSTGYYWSGDSTASSNADVLEFNENTQGIGKRVKYYGRSIRPVKDK